MNILDEVVASPGLDVVRIVCLDHNKKVLLVQEVDDVNWKLPGGKMHESETVLQAAKREVHEELGYDLQKAEITKIVKAHIPDSPNFRYIILAHLDNSKFLRTGEVAKYGFYSLKLLPITKFQQHITSAVELVHE